MSFNHWYDTQPEPTRFLLFFLPLTVLILVADFSPWPFNAVAGLAMVCALITRIRYIRR